MALLEKLDDTVQEPWHYDPDSLIAPTHGDGDEPKRNPKTLPLTPDGKVVTKKDEAKPLTPDGKIVTPQDAAKPVTPDGTVLKPQTEDPSSELEIAQTEKDKQVELNPSKD